MSPGVTLPWLILLCSSQSESEANLPGETRGASSAGGYWELLGQGLTTRRNKLGCKKTCQPLGAAAGWPMATAMARQAGALCQPAAGRLVAPSQGRAAARIGACRGRRHWAEGKPLGPALELPHRAGGNAGGCGSGTHWSWQCLIPVDTEVPESNTTGAAGVRRGCAKMC